MGDVNWTGKVRQRLKGNRHGTVSDTGDDHLSWTRSRQRLDVESSRLRLVTRGPERLDSIFVFQVCRGR